LPFLILSQLPLKKSYSNLLTEAPCIVSLILWNSITAYNIPFKNAPSKSLFELLEPNYALDIEILLNSVPISHSFITSDEGQKEYADIIFQPDLLTWSENKIEYVCGKKK